MLKTNEPLSPQASAGCAGTSPCPTVGEHSAPGVLSKSMKSISVMAKIARRNALARPKVEAMRKLLNEGKLPSTHPKEFERALTCAQPLPLP